jgi:hydrogenase maturation protease
MNRSCKPDRSFGPEVMRALRGVTVPADVRVTDFGIRSYDLAYAIADEPEVTILVDASPQGDAPGTLSLLELDPSNLDASGQCHDAHSLNPVAALQLVRAMGFGFTGRYFLVGCEPSVLECEDGEMGLSAPVAAAVPRAVGMIENVLRQLRGAEPNPNPHPACHRPNHRRQSHAIHS